PQAPPVPPTLGPAAGARRPGRPVRGRDLEGRPPGARRGTRPAAGEVPWAGGPVLAERTDAGRGGRAARGVADHTEAVAGVWPRVATDPALAAGCGAGRTRRVGTDAP